MGQKNLAEISQVPSVPFLLRKGKYGREIMGGMAANLHWISSWAGCNAPSHSNAGAGQPPSMAIVQRLRHRATSCGS